MRILGWVDLGSHLLFLISHYYFTSLYFTLIYLFGVVYVTQSFTETHYILLLFMAHDTYLSIFGDHEDSIVYHCLLFEHVWFIYVYILLAKLKF